MDMEGDLEVSALPVLLKLHLYLFGSYIHTTPNTAPFT